MVGKHGTMVGVDEPTPDELTLLLLKARQTLDTEQLRLLIKSLEKHSEDSQEDRRSLNIAEAALQNVNRLYQEVESLTKRAFQENEKRRAIIRSHNRAQNFPLQVDKAPPGPVSIPWEIAEHAYGAYARRFGKDQSLERLAERGGFSWGEMDMFYPSWRSLVDPLAQAAKREEALALMLQEARLRLAEVSNYIGPFGKHRTMFDTLTKVIEDIDKLLPPIATLSRKPNERTTEEAKDKPD